MMREKFQKDIRSEEIVAFVAKHGQDATANMLLEKLGLPCLRSREELAAWQMFAVFSSIRTKGTYPGGNNLHMSFYARLLRAQSQFDWYLMALKG